MFKKFKNWRQLEKKQRRLVIILLSLVALLILGSSAYASYRYFAKKNAGQLSENNSGVELAPPTILDPTQVEEEDKKQLAVLLLGYGGAGHQGGFLTDVIQIAHLNFEKEKITFISIPRDLEITLSNGQSKKINSVFNYGLSGEDPVKSAGVLTRNTMSQVSGLNIKYFIAVDFVGFQRLIGQSLDGLEVEVTQTLDDPWYPIEGEQLNPCGYSPEEIANLTASYSGFELESKFECRYEHLYYPAGTVQMEGGDALKYVRSRHSSSDFDRSRRQVEVLTAIRKKLFSLNALNNVPKYFKALSQHVGSDLDLESTEYLAPLFLNADQFEINRINLSTENVLTSTKNSNGFVLIPKAGNNNWSNLQNYIQENL